MPTNGGAVMISKPAYDPQINNQPRVERPVRKLTRINMTQSQVLPHLLRSNLVTLKEAPKNPNTTSPHYHPNSRCAYHSESPGHDTNNCWAIKKKIQDLIEAKEIEFDALKKPNLIFPLCPDMAIIPMPLKKDCLLLQLMNL